ncbi:hypothetical protein HZH66_013568 [Vespula vulgaris]|uniref:Uncharacterized protein n=1 Tax=Vespula vulgaris TaxID=7454 RepID=A0A834J6R7_VESVU|nr:hypothetical protein HZH66_013568 [Vespula vulgaris]
MGGWMMWAESGWFVLATQEEWWAIMFYGPLCRDTQGRAKNKGDAKGVAITGRVGNDGKVFVESGKRKVGWGSMDGRSRCMVQFDREKDEH